jgi:hypothetical protein
MNPTVHYTAEIKAEIDGKSIRLICSSTGDRMIVASGMRTLLNTRAWAEIQATCNDQLPAGNKRMSIPTLWFMATTANPPLFVRPDYRMLLRIVHLVCLEARLKGAEFSSDQILSRITPSLQVERNVLESPDYWKPPIELTTTSPSPKLHRHRSRKRRRRRRHRSEPEFSSPESELSNEDSRSSSKPYSSDSHTRPRKKAEDAFSRSNALVPSLWTAAEAERAVCAAIHQSCKHRPLLHMPRSRRAQCRWTW